MPCEQVSILSTFYVQLLCVKIQKAQRDTDNLTVIFALLGFADIKAVCKMLVKSTKGLLKNTYLKYTSHFRESFGKVKRDFFQL